MTSPPYALYVGGHEPRKNVAGLFRAMRRYWERFDKALELRLTGDRTSLCPEAAEVYERLADKSRVRFLRNVDDAELARHYADAQVLLMLSRDEGFGLPALEAMAHGCPVVAASSASLPEVVGDAGLLVDPDDADAVCDAVRLLVTSSAARGEFLERGRLRARAFGWDKTARRMREIYERVAHEPIRSSLQTACTTKDPAVACGEPLQR
jgi:glycosyltransferase involved in cell wall biosynthesis